MMEWQIDATIEGLRLQYEQGNGSVTYLRQVLTFGSDDAFEWWVYKLEQDLIQAADDDFSCGGDPIQDWQGILDRQFQSSI